jgi:phosphoserine phosphatase RsbU/P
VHKLALLLCLLSPVALEQASPPAPTVPVTRYHYGDNLQGADPTFNDSGWVRGQNGRWRLPPFDSDGFVWVRIPVAIPMSASEPLAIRWRFSGTHPGAVEVFVNGRAVGAQGAFPPSGDPVYLPPSAVFDLPTGAATPGSTAVVAMRVWYMPRSRPISRGSQATGAYGERSGSNFRTSVDLAIGNAATTHAVERAERLSRLLGSIPDLALNALLGLTGLGLFVIWRWTRRAELAWCSVLLISYPIYQCFFVATDQGRLSIHYQHWGMLWVLLTFPTMLITVEFIRAVHALPGGLWRWTAHASWIVFNAGSLAGSLALHPSAGLHAALALTTWSVQIFNLITIGANLWVLFVRRYNRVIAATMLTIPIASAMAHFGFRAHWVIGYSDFSLFDLGSVISGFAIAAMLVERAVAAWKQSQHLRVEFEAAREMQEQLVTAPPVVPGFRIESVYRPAAQVGGDFYAIRPLDTGGVQIVVGDVSGKGLRAAMTVSTIMGSLRMIAACGPAEILRRLNESLVGSLRGGFVTCLVAGIEPDGTITISNAGHLAPYRNGDEHKCDFGLPLGLTCDASWGQSTLTLAPGDTLTFLSDGVVEARNQAGELFGFERTAAISTQSSEEIARAAQHFGQEDDITVLTLQFAPAEVLHA